MSYSENDPQHYKHVENSLAIAEQISPNDIQQRIGQIAANTSSNRLLLTRASLYSELALATPDVNGDDELFVLARQDLLRITENKKLPQRHQIKLNAKMWLAYEEAFRLRALLQPITPDVTKRLQLELSHIMLDFLDGRDLNNTEYGQLSELVATSYLLDSDLFPYLASWREEANIVRADNHDMYTLHSTGSGIAKVPASLKYREIPRPNGLVVTLTVGQVALTAAQNTPPYNKNLAHYTKGKAQMDYALRLAADIMICNALGETLSTEDKALLWGLTAQLQAPLIDFAERVDTPRYASHAQALQTEIIAREKRITQAAKQAKQKYHPPAQRTTVLALKSQ